MRRRPTNSKDRAIEQEYYRQAQGRQIDVMKIGKLFAQARLSMDIGLTTAQAVEHAIRLYCEPVQP